MARIDRMLGTRAPAGGEDGEIHRGDVSTPFEPTQETATANVESATVTQFNRSTRSTQDAHLDPGGSINRTAPPTTRIMMPRLLPNIGRKSTHPMTTQAYSPRTLVSNLTEFPPPTLTIWNLCHEETLSCRMMAQRYKHLAVLSGMPIAYQTSSTSSCY